ncbi:acetyl-CoA carboxylase biotin carboxylase subunit [Microbaculum marinisediminis]|uniref:Acetyl-CoA carboxylase biotin carboxylase subunit n=1 Tax=Microbaculum marinisediminis TaxID=2931392 RepID=A0AAW5R305_9HYPH|nr:acetyl-CoA carboxylase biotin carboxylase subunit [Microbaculum sp. A6E488]MCT8973527.1 acetyl-CoA carboxylase biotin carboxylase subunit [Microbaculum sp. A6E488]
MPESKRLRRVLIANRGEIAVRLVRGCAEVGAESVAVVSEADRESMVARLATRTVCIGPSPARDSYLRPDLIVHAALATGCDAIHPGYGFLSEQPSLAELCDENGLVFVGPTAETIRMLGNKLEARRLAERADVPLLPGSARVSDAEEAARFAAEMGYPILVKAAAGGGGRGMKVVHTPSELAGTLQTTASEARSAFGDATLYLERFIADARHIEVQVLGDGKGQVVHLGDRDCSLQRRHQKVIEEAPASDIPEDVRRDMHDAAVRIARQVNYASAGTVEFLFDRSANAFYFLEMNTRLQVEHPVTEMVTGIDLVAAQLRIAGGEPLSIPEDIGPNGHSIEARITAESPENAFRPSPGRIRRWQAPDMDGLRVDTYAEAGALIPPFYDSMVAKFIVHGPDRQTAIDKMRRALEAFEVEGISTNRAFLLRLLGEPAFAAMRHNTRSIDAFLAADAAAESNA